MPLYEIVLRYPGKDKVVLSETPLPTGEAVEIAGRRWLVFDSFASSPEANRVRFVCRPTDEQNGNGDA